MADSNDGGPAFPSGTVIKGGMSLRDYFAAKALGVVSKPEFFDEVTFEELKEVCEGTADAAYMLADAMLAARKQEQIKGWPEVMGCTPPPPPPAPGLREELRG